MMYAGAAVGTDEGGNCQVGGSNRAIMPREMEPPSLIITLHRANATRDKLPIMHDWFRKLERMGVRSVRIHILGVEDEAVREKYALTVDENIEAFLSFYALSAS